MATAQEIINIWNGSKEDKSKLIYGNFISEIVFLIDFFILRNKEKYKDTGFFVGRMDLERETNALLFTTDVPAASSPQVLGTTNTSYQTWTMKITYIGSDDYAESLNFISGVHEILLEKSRDAGQYGVMALDIENPVLVSKVKDKYLFVLLLNMTTTMRGISTENLAERRRKR